MTLELENPTLLSRLEVFAVALPETAEHFDLAPFGLPISHVVNPLRVENAVFLDLLERLDALTFGPEGMPMPRWVYLDGAELTGTIIGLGVPVSRAPAAIVELLDVPADYRGIVPYSVYIAIPTYRRGEWFGHNLAALTGLLPDENLGGLGSLTKALALAAMRTEVQVGATQWDSRALFVHARLGRLELSTAWTPAHGEDGTLTYRVEVNEEGLRNLARHRGSSRENESPNRWLDSRDHDAMLELQREIEAGARVAIVGRPELIEGGQKVPLRVSRSRESASPRAR